MNTEKSKTNEPHKFVLNLSQILGWRSSKKHVALQNYLLHVEKFKKTVWETLTTIPLIHVYLNSINKRFI